VTITEGWVGVASSATTAPHDDLALLVYIAYRSLLTVPWDPEVVLARFRENTIQRPSSSESSQSVLQADNWRRIERLLKEVVANVHDDNTKKLSLTLHHLSTENIMLKSRCKGLEEALANEKKRRQRGKPLALQLQAPESGNAVFYSPKKIQQARDLQKQKDEGLQQAKAAKEEAKLRRQQEKEEKKRVTEERKRIKALERQIRLQEAEEKKGQNEYQKEEARIAKDAETQLQNYIKAAKQSKPKPPATPKAPRKQIHPPQTPEAIPKAPTTVNRRGRQIRLPHRFREL
jgi:pyruvate/2-oxoglutarate dehydrogenase complex dihydrolipoamide acyltransferase (E2) component